MTNAASEVSESDDDCQSNVAERQDKNFPQPVYIKAKCAGSYMDQDGSSSGPIRVA
jgi:hypothetical protein